MMLSRRAALAFVFGLGLSLLTACSPGKPRALTFPIGQKVQVGKLFYQVVDAQWGADAPGAKQPAKNRVLQLHFTVTNSSHDEASIPFLRLIDANGNEVMELADIEGNSKWMGTVRRLRPSITEEGFIYFDVPIGAYKFEVVDNTVADDEKVAYIEIPASLAPPPPTPGPTGL